MQWDLCKLLIKLGLRAISSRCKNTERGWYLPHLRCTYCLRSLDANKKICAFLRLFSFSFLVFRILISSTAAVSCLMCRLWHCWDDGAVKWGAQVSHVSLVSYSTYSEWVTQTHSAAWSEFWVCSRLPGCGTARGTSITVILLLLLLFLLCCFYISPSSYFMEPNLYHKIQ